VKGKGEDGACMDYALALSSRLAANGIHGQLIFYRWHIRNTAIQGSHVFVVYRLPDDSEWIVDNEIPHPRQVPREANPMQLVFLLSGARSAPVDVELQDGLNHLSYF
jgi:predicted transglutaminase-like cysteine proteinase